MTDWKAIIEDHIKNIVFRTSPFQHEHPTQESWYRTAGIEGERDMEVLMLAFATCAQTIAAWQIDADLIEEDDLAFAQYVALCTGVSRELGKELFPLAAGLVKGKVIRRKQFPSVKSFQDYLFGMHSHMFWTFVGRGESGDTVGEALRAAMIRFLEEADMVQGTVLMPPYPKLIEVSAGMGLDYLATFRGR